MADRMHPYPMFPQNLTPNSLQQPQIPQHPQQSQQPDPQMMSALSNPEHPRMWQMNQLQNYRPQQSGDLAAAQMNHQMQDFARGQTLTHGQGQPIVQQIQQSFTLNAQRMNPSGPVFHDPQANLSQLLMSNNSPNVPMNTQQQMKAPFNMNAMAHATLNNPGVSRQFKMLSQQEMARLQQSGLGGQHQPNQPTAVDMFATTSMQPPQDQMHGSPHPVAQPIGPPGANQAMVPGNQQTGVQKRMVTPTEFQERRSYLLGMISQSEMNLESLSQTVRGATAVDTAVQQKISQLRSEIANRKEVYNKFVATFGAIVTQQMANGIPPGNMPHINPMQHATSQQPQQGNVSNPQVQSGFVTQANQPVMPQYNVPAGGSPSQMPPQAQGGLNQQIPIGGAQIGRPGTIPPRTGSTPHQMAAGQLQNNMSPNLNFASQVPQKVANPSTTRQSGPVLPLDKQLFDTTYGQFCRSQNVPMGTRVTIGEGRLVDLHQLHVQVIREGGASAVTQHDLWSVIGGRMGFVQFPGTDTEPARSGPGIAQQLHHAYEQYLQHFENAYFLTVKNRPAGQGGSPQPQPPPTHPMNPSPLAISNTTTTTMSGNPPEMATNAPRQMNQQVVVAATRYVHMSVQEMRNQRVHEHMVNFVERHRSELLKWRQQMQIYAKRNAEQEQQNNVNVQNPLPNVPEQAPTGLQSGAQRSHQVMGVNPIVGMASGNTKPVNGSFAPEHAAVTALNLQPPTREQIQHADMVISQLKHVFQQRSLPGMATQVVPEEHRLEYNQHLDQLFKMTSELDRRLDMYLAVFKNDELLRRYIAIVMTVDKQRQLLTAGSSQYIIPFANLRTMQLQVHKLNEEFENRWRAMRAAAAAANSHPHAPLPPTPARKPSPLAVAPTPNPHMVPTTSSSNGRPGSINPPPPQPSHLQLQPSHTPIPPQPHQTRTQPNHPQPPVPPQQLPVPPPTKKHFPSIPSPSALPATTNIASPTPPPAAASSSTPATSAPTPQTAMGSPQTPKSPPSRAGAKAKTTRVTRKVSTGRSPATPETAPSTVAGVKRPPEEDVSVLATVAPSEAEASNAPSPKKAKMEWEGEPSEALIKRQQELENIKTDEEAAAFLDRMKELLDLSASTDNEIPHDMLDQIQILASVAQEPADAAATAAALSVRGAGDAGPPPTALSPHMGAANDAFLLEFFDFSSFTTLDDEDNDSKAPTPDLVPSSETNPSPESGPEGDLLGNTGSPDKIKIEELGDRSDPLRLGFPREIDGGELTYYQGESWKWEGPMYTLDQPWAILS